MRYYFLRFPGGKPKAVTFSYDDGVKQDLRLAELFLKYGLKATFNVNRDRGAESSVHLTLAEIKEKIYDRGFEIAIHGKDHLAPGLVPTVTAIADELDCKRELEQAFGTIVRGSAYPDSGLRIPLMTGAKTAEEDLSRLGIAYSRTLGGDNDSFCLPGDFYAWMPTIHHNNTHALEWAQKFADMDYSEMRGAARQPRLFYVWGHSYEFDRNDNWEHMEALCGILAGKEDTWYATNIEICDYVNAYRALQFSADQKMVFNPTCQTVILGCFRSEAEMQFPIGPGETVRLAD